MAEGLLNHWGAQKFMGFSAGSYPTGKVHPLSLATLARHGMKSHGYESKSWDVFKNLDEIHIVITVCDNAAGETCPLFPGKPIKAHWGAPDPAHFQGTPEEIEAEFDRVFGILERRIQALVALPAESMAADALSRSLNEIGKMA